jgi:carboxymethylenebutenolidase
MCFDTDALPPDPGRSGMLRSSERRALVAEDGNRFASTFGWTESTGAPGVVILPDIRGLHPYYERLAERFADAGVHAAAVDPYGRTAGAEHRGDDFDHAPHRAAARDDTIRADVRAASTALREAGATKIVALGFCFGGRAAFLQASQEGIDAAVGFYGWPARREEGGPSPIDEARAGLVRVPVLALYGGADEKITPEDRRAYDAALEASGAPHESVVYDGAPHGFFDRRMTEHSEACRDAWARVLRLVDG